MSKRLVAEQIQVITTLIQMVDADVLELMVYEVETALCADDDVNLVLSSAGVIAQTRKRLDVMRLVLDLRRRMGGEG